MEIPVYEIQCEASRQLFMGVDTDIWNFVKSLNLTLPKELQLCSENYFVEAKPVVSKKDSEAHESIIRYYAFWTYQINHLSYFSKNQVPDFKQPNCVTLKMEWAVDLNTQNVTDDLYTISLHFKGGFPEVPQVVIDSAKLAPGNVSVFFSAEMISKLAHTIRSSYRH